MNIILFNKPYKVLCQFTDKKNTIKYRENLSNYINQKGFYAAGRLDYNSEGLLILTNNGAFQNKISNPKNKMKKSYLVQVEGHLDKDKIKVLQDGVYLKDGMTLPTKLQILSCKPDIWERQPKVQEFRNNNSHWYKITLSEGRNRQVRRMFAKIGHPVLRLIRQKIGPWEIGNIKPGKFKKLCINFPVIDMKN